MIRGVVRTYQSPLLAAKRKLLNQSDRVRDEILPGVRRLGSLTHELLDCKHLNDDDDDRKEGTD